MSAKSGVAEGFGEDHAAACVFEQPHGRHQVDPDLHQRPGPGTVAAKRDRQPDEQHQERDEQSRCAPLPIGTTVRSAR